MGFWPIAGLLACELYLILERTSFWHQSDQVYHFLAKTHIFSKVKNSPPPRGTMSRFHTVLSLPQRNHAIRRLRGGHRLRWCANPINPGCWQNGLLVQTALRAPTTTRGDIPSHDSRWGAVSEDARGRGKRFV